MSTCFNVDDVLELSEATLSETDRRLQEIPPDLCAPFYAEASNLEQQLLGVYRTVVLCVRKEDDIDKISSWWKTMTQICDDFAKRLSKLTEAHPYCGAGVFYDRVLDLRNRCERLREMHS